MRTLNIKKKNIYILWFLGSYEYVNKKQKEVAQRTGSTLCILCVIFNVAVSPGGRLYEADYAMADFDKRRTSTSELFFAVRTNLSSFEKEIDTDKKKKDL